MVANGGDNVENDWKLNIYNEFLKYKYMEIP